jgi:hypothetical protein
MPRARNNHYVKIAYTKKDRKFQSQSHRINPNHQEECRQARHQRTSSSSLVKNSPEINIVTTLFLMSLLITPVAATQIKKTNLSLTDEDAPFEYTTNTTATIATKEVTNSSTQALYIQSSASIQFFHEPKIEDSQKYLYQENNKYINKKENYHYWPLEKILKEDNLDALKIYLKNKNDLFKEDLLIKFSGETYYPYKIWSFLLNNSKEGGWQYFKKRPQLLLFHVYREASKNHNDDLVYILNQSSVLEETKLAIATLRNIEKYIKQNNILQLDKLLELYPVARELFSDAKIQVEIRIFVKNANKNMRDYIEIAFEKFGEINSHNEKPSNN